MALKHYPSRPEVEAATIYIKSRVATRDALAKAISNYDSMHDTDAMTECVKTLMNMVQNKNIDSVKILFDKLLIPIKPVLAMGEIPKLPNCPHEKAIAVLDHVASGVVSVEAGKELLGMIMQSITIYEHTVLVDRIGALEEGKK